MDLLNPKDSKKIATLSLERVSLDSTDHMRLFDIICKQQGIDMDSRHNVKVVMTVLCNSVMWN